MKENNILLAKFLGWREVVPNGWKFQATMPNYISVDVPNFDFRDIDVIDTFETTHDDMKFDSDWNWLMLVVDKISKTENFLYPNGMFKYLVSVKLDVSTKCIEIEDFYRRNIGGEGFYIKIYEDSLIKNTYQACVEFVKWYNNNKQI